MTGEDQQAVVDPHPDALPSGVSDLTIDPPALDDEPNLRTDLAGAAELYRQQQERSVPSASLLMRFLRSDSLEETLRLWGGDDAVRLANTERQSLRLAIDRTIAEIDDLLSEQIDSILRAPRMKTLEAAWRGLKQLVDAARPFHPHVKVKFLSITWVEVVRDLERAADFDQSDLFNKIYSQEFGIAGGEPFGLLVGDYHLSHRRSQTHPTDDVSALKNLAMIASAAFAPFVAGCDPSLFDLESFTDLSHVQDVEGIFLRPEYARWRSLRQEMDCRYIGLCLPRVLFRRPWRKLLDRADGFMFRTTEGFTSDDYLWGNAAFSFAAVAIRAFGQSGWFAEIRGAPRGKVEAGIVNNLPIDSFTTDRADIAFKHPIEVAISDRKERQISGLGLIPLSVAEYTPNLVFYSNQALIDPGQHATLEAMTNARLSSMLQYMLCIGRFAHTLKVLGRERIGSFLTPQECEQQLQKWIVRYVNANPNASIEAKTRFPLQEARVRVSERPGRPGVFKMDVHLRPHLQLDDITTGINLTTELAPQHVA